MWLGNNAVCPEKFFSPPKELGPVFNFDSLMYYLLIDFFDNSVNNSTSTHRPNFDVFNQETSQCDPPN